MVTEDKDIIIEEVLNSITIHFAGKTKPWHVLGMKYPLGCFFQEKYREIYKKNYFISPFNKIRHIKEVLDFINNRKNYCVENYFKFLSSCLIKIIKL